MSLDRNSIDKETARLGVEALMFWELPKVEEALNALCKKWFINNCRAYSKNTLVLSVDTENTTAATLDSTPATEIILASKSKVQNIELGFVEKLIELWRLRKRIDEAKAEISVSGVLAKYKYRAGEAIMDKCLDYKSSYMHKLYKARNLDITMNEKRQAALIMYENYICQYKALLLQCEQDYDLMINVRLYHEIILPFFKVKHGQFAAVALTRSGANKLLKKVWESFIIRRDRIIMREHHKILNTQKKFDDQLKAAQRSAGEQIDSRCDKNLANLDAKVKSIIKETVKSASIKKESMMFDSSLIECDLTMNAIDSRAPPLSQTQTSSKRSRQPETIDLRSPPIYRKPKRFDDRNNTPRHQGNPKYRGNLRQNFVQQKGYLYS